MIISRHHWLSIARLTSQNIQNYLFFLSTWWLVNFRPHVTAKSIVEKDNLSRKLFLATQTPYDFQIIDIMNYQHSYSFKTGTGRVHSYNYRKWKMDCKRNKKKKSNLFTTHLRMFFKIPLCWVFTWLLKTYANKITPRIYLRDLRISWPLWCTVQLM